MNHSLVWSEIPDESERAAPEDEEQPAEVDETLGARRVRRWLQGMFGERSAEESAD